MSVREPLSWEENLVAAIAGTGLLLAIVAGLLTGFGSEDTNTTRVLLFAGLGLIGAGIALWLTLLRPWEKFDDLVEPYYTGHHHDEHDEHHAVAELSSGDEAHPIAEAAAPSEPVVAQVQEIAPVVEPTAEVATSEDIGITPAPEVIDAEAEDDLKVIEGIGPKTEEALKASGIKTFAAVAALSAEELERIVKVEHGVRIVGSTSTWRRQAKLAAAGEFGALDDLKSRIKSGYLYDDLTEIEGIGPKIQEALYEAKIRSYEDLAAADLDTLHAALQAAGISSGRHIETWSQQAQLLVDGDISGFEALKASLQ